MIKKILKRFLLQKLNVKFTVIMVAIVMLPIIILMAVWQYSIQKTTIEDHINYNRYTIDRYAEQVNNQMTSINMVTQFFKKDRKLLSFLLKNNNGQKMSLAELREFKETEIISLERLVNNNLSLYGVRVYVGNDSVQEMMPILYGKSRMERQSWEQEGITEGWYYGYEDMIFSQYASNNKNQLITLLTPIYDNYGRVGVIEAAMKMDEMFPDLYAEQGTEGGFVISKNGEVYLGNNPCNLSESLANTISKKVKTDAKQKFQTEYLVQNGRNFVVSKYYISEIEASYIFVRDITSNMQKIIKRQFRFIVITIILTVVMAFVINIVVKLLLKKMYGILDSVHDVQKGNLEVHFDDSGRDEIAELGGQINKMLEHIRKLMNESIQREVLVKNSEIKALQNQINAHFIYNVLESIKMMAEIEERYEISDAITALGELLRYSMRWVKGNVSVGEELEYIQNYVQLINLRCSFEVHLAIKMPKLLYSQEIPKMSLQPIVENAIIHGIEQQAEDATIYIKGILMGDDYQIEITDSGQGMNGEQVERLVQMIHGKIESSGGSGNGIGLKNVQNRIQLNFGEKYGLSVISKEKCFTKIVLLLPLNRQNSANFCGGGGITVKTLLIVEDEKMIRHGIAVMAQRTSVPIKEVIECKNGVEALKILETQHVDAVFTDIRMPQMNGIDLVQEMRKRSYRAVVAVISGYDDFNYAVDMLKSGVSDYILKPIKRDKLEEVLWNMKEKLQQEGQRSKNYMRAVVHQLKSYLLDGNLSEEEQSFLQSQMYEFFPEGIYYVMIGGKRFAECFEQENVLIFEDWRYQSVVLMSKERADQYIEAKLSEWQMESDVEGENEGDKLQKSYIRECGIGRSQKAVGISDLNKAYQEALIARKQAFVTGRPCVEFTQVMTEYPLENAASIEKLAKQIAAEDCSSGLKELQDMYFHAKHGKVGPDSILSKIEQIHAFLNDNYKNMLRESEWDRGCEPLPLSFSTLEEFEAQEEEWLEGLHNLIVMHLNENTNQEKIYRAMQYIKENYKEDINMAMVSNHVSMNYSLFSIVFKEFTGVNFVNYLKQIRIQEAKRLLLETDEKILDISRSVGYENEKYFMKTFKAVCGISPSEYRKCNKEQYRSGGSLQE